MQTRFVQARSVSPGVGWQRWSPAALPSLARLGAPASSLPPRPTAVQRRLIDHTLHCIRAVQRLSRLPSHSGRAGAVSERWSGAMALRIDRLDRAIDALGRYGVWLWWRESASLHLDLWFLRVGR
jgi:hypothetical protein